MELLRTKLSLFQTVFHAVYKRVFSTLRLYLLKIIHMYYTTSIEGFQIHNMAYNKEEVLMKFTFLLNAGVPYHTLF